MSNPAPTPAPVAWAAPRGPSVRIRGVALFVLLIVEILLGNQLAVVGSPYPVGYLAAHIGLGLVLIGFSGYSLWVAARIGRGSATASAALTCLTTVGAVISGFVFLFGNQSNGALLGMEAFGGVALLGAILMVVFGGSRTAAAAPATGPG